MVSSLLLYTAIFSSSILFLFIAHKSRTSHKHPVSQSESLPSPPAPSAKPKRTYDVFLSFRGEDTRNNFVGHLYDSLDRYGIYTFKDDEKLKRGKTIAPELLKAIEESRFSIVVLSENYATSRWCLDELVKIIESHDRFGQIVVPVFHNIDPSHVRNQMGSFKTAFDQHEKIKGNKTLQWREALTRVSSFSGFDSRNRDESVIIQNIVREISDKLFSESSIDDSTLVGMGYHMEQMDSLLCNCSDDVLMVGIWGMGGIGKTTISKALFDRFSRYYDGKCYVANVKDIFRKHSISLHERLLSDILLDKNLNLRSLDGGRNVIKERLSHKKVFIVLDDVDDVEQLESLAGKHDWFGPGSRIVITTRDQHLLVTHGVNFMYKVENLKDKEALQLFKQYAFKRDHPTTDYLELSNEFVSYAKGLPLALKVLGSFLYKRTMLEWSSELKKLQKIPNAKIQDVLRISFDGLDYNQKAIFLDIACFFKGENKDSTTEIFESCDLFPDIDVKVLVDKSLITISYNMVFMHDLLQEMGWEVVHQESVKEPGMRSRLWLTEDVCHVFKYSTGTEAVEAIFLDLSNIKDFQLNCESFKGMHNLRLLKIYSSNHNRGFEESCRVQISGSLKFLSNNLRYLYWYKYPLECLPCNFHPENLIELNMPYSNLERPWEGTEYLMKIKRMKLSHSQNLKDTGDLSEAQNLELMDLDGCISLQEIHPSIKRLDKLIVLSLRDCKNLKCLPDISNLESLEDLTLSGCSYIEKLPQLPENIKHLRLDSTAIQEFPQSFEILHNLVTLSVKDCKFLSSLPEWIPSLKSLENLNISGCSKITTLPNNFGYLSSLMKLEAKGVGINRLPSSIISCKSLVKLSLTGCKGEYGASLVLPPLWGLHSLKKLNLSDCNIAELPEGLVGLSLLEKLDLSRNIFERIDASFEELYKLSKLKLKECKLLQSIPKLPPSIQIVDTYDCNALEEVLSSMSKRDYMMEFTPDTLFARYSACLIFANCYKLNQNSIRNLMIDVQERLQHDTKSYIGLARQRIHGWYEVKLIYPSSEIPEWFPYQSEGPTVAMQLNPEPGSILLGFMVCAVVEFVGCLHDKDFILKYDFVLRENNGPIEPRDSSAIYSWFSKRISITLDHVLIGYTILNPFKLIPIMYTQAAAKLYTASKMGSQSCLPLECCKVKKCGILPIYIYGVQRL